MTNFDRSLREVLKDEGGYSNHPKDPGGATNFGIIQRVYDDFRKRNGQRPQSVKQITEAEVSTIYRTNYWSLAKCDQLPDGVDYVVFDGAVNSGVGQSIKWLQRALGVKDDGVIGPATIGAAQAHPNYDALVNDICDNRLRMLKALKTWPTFGKGWARRVERVRMTGKAWAAGDDGVKARPALPVAPAAKGYASDAVKPPSPAIGDSATGAGGAGLVLTQAINQLTPMSQVEFISKLVAWLTVISVLIMLGGFAYSVWSRKRKAEIKDAVQP